MKNIFIKIVASKYNINLEQEVYFHNKRKWRFDLADKKNKIAIEIEGGIWTRGAHGRGTGIMRDIEKYNAAQSLGWRIFRTVPIRFKNEKNIGKLIAEFGDFLFPKSETLAEVNIGNTAYSQKKNKVIKAIINRSRK
jgi:hypothetical protein